MPRSAAVGGRLAGEIYERLKRDLLTGRYRAGEALAVTALRDEFGVSKQPIMEALRALAADRLVSIQPQVGVRVMSYAREEVDAFFALFARAEGAMAHRAALHHHEHQLRELADLCAQLEGGADRAGAGERYITGNRAVHRVIHEMAQSELAARISADLWDLSDFLVVTHGHGFSGKLDERNHGHREILSAITAGDAEAAERAMTEHILSSPLAQRHTEETVASVFR